MQRNYDADINTKLQSIINQQSLNAILTLPPGEFLGQVTIDRALIVEGQGKKTWIGSRNAPTIKISSPGVVLRKVMVESTHDLNHVAIEALPGTDPVLEDVVVRGRVVGIRPDKIRNLKEYVIEQQTAITFTTPPPMNRSFPEGAAHDTAETCVADEEVDVERVQQLLTRLAESWMTIIGALGEERIPKIQAGLETRIDRFNSATDVDDGFRIMNYTYIRRDLKQAAEECVREISTAVDPVLERAYPFLRHKGFLWSDAAEKEFQSQTLKELESSFHSLDQLGGLEAHVRSFDKGYLTSILEGGALGAAAGALTGGLGIIAALAYSWWKGEKEGEEAARAWEHYINGLNTFWTATNEAMERIYERLWHIGANYYDEILIPALDEEDVTVESIEAFDFLLLELRSDLGCSAQESTAGEPLPEWNWRLVEAVKIGESDEVERLLGQGAEANIQAGDGSPLLLEAVSVRSVKTVRVLLDHGADPNAPNKYGVTALIEAARMGNIGMAYLLVERGAEVNARSNLGWTPLMEAANRGHTEIVRLLVERGADPSITNRNGHDALHFARAKGHTSIVRLLMNALSSTSQRCSICGAADAPIVGSNFRWCRKCFERRSALPHLELDKGLKK